MDDKMLLSRFQNLIKGSTTCRKHSRLGGDMAKQFDFLFKFLLIGDSGVGKTCIIYRFVENKFDSSFVTTIGIDFKIKTVELGERFVIRMFDTSIN